eukprot:CAMPEP_0184520118 /NCGR_PEP_ID=MMETSP0198_2-20121128/6994_1 /TAXON_ID=1112570 /ORGANISM="Thraustochytrium sp., Strain LLF1b" /LENGTH=452 /DNA_ID=CAMNT_0026910689 /DNA_START=151 /DNA_END=1505 /DNA_ORIENTATION=-
MSESEALVPTKSKNDALVPTKNTPGSMPSTPKESIFQRRTAIKGSLSQSKVEHLQDRIRATPSPETLGVNLKARKTHPSHVLQETLSYIEPLNLNGRRPQVYVKRPKSGRLELARCGLDMFRKAGVPYDQPLVVIRQDAKTFDVTISSIQALDWLNAIKHRSNKSESEDLLEIVPAGSFSYRTNSTGYLVRLAIRMRHYTSLKALRNQVPAVRVAAVVIPEVMYNGKRHLIITQRVKKHKGTYNSLYVFPGGHVEARETLEEGAIREFREETGLDVKLETLKMVCCWQEMLLSKNLHFLMLVYSACVVSYDKSGEFSFDDIALQKDEVAKLALLPEEIWDDVANRNLQNTQVEGVTVDQETGSVEPTQIYANDITGHHLSFGQGIGSAHRYALLQFLNPLDNRGSENGDSTLEHESSISSRRLSQLRHSTVLMNTIPAKAKDALERSWSQDS